MLDRRMRRQVESAFYKYPVNCKAEAEYVAEQYTGGLTSQFDRIGRSTAVSDPTGNKAARLADGSHNLLWCRVVEQTMEHFRGTDKLYFIESRYYHCDSEIRTCDHLFISHATYYE